MSGFPGQQLHLPGLRPGVLELAGRRPLLLDLYCGAGGAAAGYHAAGWDVIGVDVRPQPRYPYPFVLADALTYPLDDVDAIHASPPCQLYSTTRTLHDAEYPDLVAPTIARLDRAGVPWVCENVVGAPLTNCVQLCGSSFGLGVRRHRRFQTNWHVWNPPRCAHVEQGTPLDVTGGGSSTRPRRQDPGDVRGGRSRKPRNLAEARAAMGVDWMTRAELNEAIPPAYTAWLGRELLAQL